MQLLRRCQATEPGSSGWKPPPPPVQIHGHGSAGSESRPTPTGQHTGERMKLGLGGLGITQSGVVERAGPSLTAGLGSV